MLVFFSFSNGEGKGRTEFVKGGREYCSDSRELTIGVSFILRVQTRNKCLYFPRNKNILCLFEGKEPAASTIKQPLNQKRLLPLARLDRIRILFQEEPFLSYSL